MKKLSIMVLAITLLLAFSAGSVSASSSSMLTNIEDVKGTKYKYGGNTTSGFDCSGFVRYIFEKMDVELPRRSADQASEGTKVAKDNLKSGDLVFFDTSGSNNGGITHVGIYIGDGKFAHASTSKGVTIDSLDSSYYKPRYVTARRVLSDEQYENYVEASK
ncbi:MULTISPECIES: C40 family peptidase [Paenibacillus]|uniref:C40 family peptidase n=1 Tax=Paenibacillus TaxID=44249 RepID=UPI00203C649D|nr:C40 family peptidase [Paenibacillus camelliae]